MGSLRGIVRTCWSPCLAPLRPEASRPHAQAARWRTCRQRRPSGGSSARLRCAGRRVRRGRGGGACGCGYGGMGERERLRPELAGGHGDSAAQERRERVREGREREGTTEGAQGELDPHSALSIEQQAMAERRSAARCMEDTHQTRVAHRRISPSTWRATK